MNFLLINLISFASISTFADTRSPVLVTSDIEYYNAVYSCPQNSHLPTAREFAKFAQDNGAKGILELEQIDTENVPGGYTKISVFNSDGYNDQFYYSSSGFPNNILHRGPFWTSSSLSISSIGEGILGFRGFNGIMGANVYLYSENGIKHNGLLCFTGPAVSYTKKGDLLDENGIIRNLNGINRRMVMSYARVACPAGTHLPSLREFAREAQLHGAKGILEVVDVPDGKVSPGYNRYSVLNSDGQLDEFYFSGNGYKPQDDISKFYFWTSSVDIEHQNAGWAFGFMDDLNGAFPKNFDAQNEFVSIRCFKN